MTATYDGIEILSVESLLDNLEDKHLPNKSNVI